MSNRRPLLENQPRPPPHILGLANRKTRCRRLLGARQHRCGHAGRTAIFIASQPTLGIATWQWEHARCGLRWPRLGRHSQPRRRFAIRERTLAPRSRGATARDHWDGARAIWRVLACCQLRSYAWRACDVVEARRARAATRWRA